MLDSGSRGIPAGLKFSFKGVIRYQNILGGRMQLTFRTTGFAEHEYFRILINGVVLRSSSANTDTKGESGADEDGFVTIRSRLIQYGHNSFEIAVISHRENRDHKSTARVQLKKI